MSTTSGLFNFLAPHTVTLMHTDVDLIPEILRVTQFDTSNPPHPLDRRAVYELLSGRVNDCTRLINELLSIMHPSLALRTSLIETTLTEPQMQSLVEAGFERFHWMLSVAGGGTKRDDNLLISYINCAARWSALSAYHRLLEFRSQDLPVSISNNDAMETTRRLLTTEIRYTWVSELILRSAATIISSDNRFKKLDHFMHSTVVEVFDIFRSFFKSAEFPWELWRHKASDAAKKLVLSLSVSAGSLSGKSCVNLILDLDYERYPFVTFDGEALPISVKQALFNPEQAFFEYARRILTNGKDRADLFELVISDVLNKVLPADITVLNPPLAIKSLSKQDKGETDFALMSDKSKKYVVVGEAKSHFISPRTDVVINDFETEMGKAATQIRRRISYFSAGSMLTTGDGKHISSKEFGSHGVIVPLHSYATAIYNEDALHAIKADDRSLSIIPIHSLIVVAQTINSGEELNEYLIFRRELISSGIKVLDEIDILITHLWDRGQAVISSARASKDRNEQSILRGLSIPILIALEARMPYSRTDWRRKIRTDVSRV